MAAGTSGEAKRLFLEALELEPEAREALLGSVDGDVARRVRSLLEAHERAEAMDAAIHESLAGSGGPADEPPRLGDYELLGEIAAGGMGVVYRARQRSLDRTVAVKLLRSGRLASEGEVARFRAEAEAAARLDHPRIVPIYEVGAERGRHFFSMKLIEGPSLDRCVERYRADPRAAAQLMAQVARAVHHGHQRGVLHRDLKPSNILLDAEGTPYVTDFGTAKLLDGDVARRADLTATGLIVGTPAYMAPEQATAGAEVTVATDVYALGCVLYELLTGRPPFEGGSVAELFRRIEEDVPPSVRGVSPQVHRDLETVCMRCLAKQPSRRYGSALELAQDLERWLAHEPILARPTTATERLWLAWKRKPALVGLAAAVLVLLLLLAAGATVASVKLRHQRDRAIGAEESANARLRTSLLAQARALRRSGEVGRRRRGLELLSQAAEIAPGRDLVDEAIACLALTDLSVADFVARDRQRELGAVFDPPLERVATIFEDGTIEVRRAVDGALLSTLPGEGEPAWGVQLQGRWLAAKYHVARGPRTGRFALWDLEAEPPAPRQELAIPADAGTSAFSRDGRTLAFVSGEGLVQLYDLERGETRLEMEVEETPGPMAFSPDGTRLALSLRSAGVVELRSPTDGSLRGRLEHGSRIQNLSWSGDGSRLAVACFDFRAHVWDVAHSEPVAVLAGHEAEVVAVALHPTRDLLATYSWDETTRLWDVSSGEQLVVTSDLVHQFSPDGRLLAFSNPRGTGRWAVDHDDHLSTLHGHAVKGPQGMDVSPDGRLLATCASDGILLREVPGQRVLDQVGEPAVSVVFDPDGRSLLAAGSGGLLRWPVEQGRFGRGSTGALLEGPVEHLDVSADGRRVVTLRGRRLVVLHPDDPTRDGSFEGYEGIAKVAVSPDGAWVATGNWRGRGARVWSAEDGAVLAELCPDERSIDVAFSPDGAWLGTGSSTRVRLWRTGTWEEAFSVERPEPTNLPARMAFDPSSRWVAVQHTNRDVSLIDLADGSLLASFEAPDREPVTQIVFAPDGSRLIVSTSNQHVQVWDLVGLRSELARAGLDHGLERAWPVER